MEFPYDELYRQIDLVNKPFGYSKEYSLWREGQVKLSFMKHISKQGKLLDAGGGMGWLAMFLPKWFLLKDYYNLDPSKVMLSHSPYRNNTLGFCEEIPFGDEFFDYVVCSEVLEHVNDKEKSLCEMVRVLKPSGILIITTPRTGWRRSFVHSHFIVFLALDKILLKLKKPKPVSQTPAGVKDEPSGEKWLRENIEQLGLTVIEQRRIDNHVPWSYGVSRFWCWFSDHFVDSRKYGHCTLIIAKKEE